MNHMHETINNGKQRNYFRILPDTVCLFLVWTNGLSAGLGLTHVSDADATCSTLPDLMRVSLPKDCSLFTVQRSIHINLQPKTGCLLKLSRAEHGQYLDGRPPGKTRLLLEEV